MKNETMDEQTINYIDKTKEEKITRAKKLVERTRTRLHQLLELKDHSIEHGYEVKGLLQKISEFLDDLEDWEDLLERSQSPPEEA